MPQNEKIFSIWIFLAPTLELVPLCEKSNLHWDRKKRDSQPSGLALKRGKLSKLQKIILLFLCENIIDKNVENTL